MCDKEFTRKGYLRAHLQGHNTERTGRLYDNMFRLKAVERSDIVGLTRAAEELGVNEHTLKSWCLMSKKPHICTICGKGFPYNAQLMAHNKIHTYTPQAKLDKEKKLLNSQDFPNIVICVERPIAENTK